MKIILGLGNPGARYAGHRHNIGFHCIDLLAARLGIRLRASSDEVWEGMGQLAGVPVVLARPRTYMNRSGRAARELLRHHASRSSQVETLLVAHDEVDLPLGTIRVKEGGGHGGHNGLRSLIEVLQDPGFIRIRLGVGRPADNTEDLADWVLSDFTRAEAVAARLLAEQGGEALETAILHGAAVAMSRFNVSERKRG